MEAPVLDSSVVGWKPLRRRLSKRIPGLMGMNENSNATTVVAEPLKLNELVAYQRESIVSRTLVDIEGSTVTAFAFDAKQGLSEHTAPYDAMVIILEGEADITIAGKEIHVKEGEMIIMPANEPHAVKAINRFKMLLIMIRAR
jgi:quercetin dioxygenase-like cupin family protein